MSALLEASGNELFINLKKNRYFAYFLFGNNLFKQGFGAGVLGCHFGPAPSPP